MSAPHDPARCPRCGCVMARDNYVHTTGNRYCEWNRRFTERGGVSAVLKDANAALRAELDQVKAAEDDD